MECIITSTAIKTALNNTYYHFKNNADINYGIVKCRFDKVCVAFAWVFLLF